MNYNYVADGSILVDGSSENASSYFSDAGQGVVYASGVSESAASYYADSGSGSILVDGSAVQRKNLRFSASGSINLSSSSPSAISKYSYEAFGSSAAGSSGICICRPTFSGSGVATISYLASAPTNFLSEWSLDVHYDVFQSVEMYKDFSYDVGDLPYRTWRVVGVEYYDCNHIPFCAVPNGLNRMFQEIIARTLSEVCQFLTDVKWTWPIAEIQRSIYPADAFIAVGSTGINVFGDPVPSTNQFVSVPFSQIPECLFLSVPTTNDVTMGIVSEVEYVFPFQASGGVSLTGVAGLVQRFSASGSVSVSGSSESTLGNYEYESSGSALVEGQAEITKDSWNYEASGAAMVAGEALEGSQYYKTSGSGSLTAAGEATSITRLRFVSSGGSDVYPIYAGVNVGGEASYPILQIGSGSAYISGQASALRNLYSYINEGAALLDGYAVAVSPYQQYSPTGGLSVSGDIVVNKASYQIAVDDSSPVSLGGESPNRNSLLGNFWYTPLLQDILLSGSSAQDIVSFYYDAQGSVNVDGAMDCDVYLAGETSAGILSEVEYVEIAFGTEFVSNIPAATATAITTCSGCPPIPNVLYMTNNIAKTNVFSEFMLRNNVKLDDYFTLYYNSRTETWQNSMHFRGVGGDNSQSQESWQINMDWSCVAQFGEDYLSSSMWKFALYMRQNDSQGGNRETRIVVLFPSETICQQASAFGLDFTFDFHFRNDYVTNSLGFAVDVFNHYDTIGAFSGSYWDANNFVCRITAVPALGIYNTIDISAERPAPRQQFYV